MSLHEKVELYCDAKRLHRNEGRTGVENLCRLVRGLGYKDCTYFGQLAHDASIGDLIEFLEDNSGCIEAIKEWIGEQNASEWADNLGGELCDDDDSDDSEDD